MEDAKWDKNRLYNLVQDRLGDYLFLLISNREPYSHEMTEDGIVCKRPVGGLTEALDPVMRASGGTWIAHGSGGADREAVDANDRVAVPPEKPEYTLRRVWLSEEEVAGFYLGDSPQQTYQTIKKYLAEVIAKMKEEDIIRLITKQTTPDEKKEILSRISDNPESKEKYYEFKNLWALTSQSLIKKKPNISDIHKFKETIHKKKSVILRKKIATLFKYAAILVIVFISGRFIFQDNIFSKTEFTQKFNEIKNRFITEAKFYKN